MYQTKAPLFFSLDCPVEGELQHNERVLDEKIAEHLISYEKAIREELAIELRIIQINYIGLPRSGKTSFLQRILGNILNILEEEKKGKKEQSSTGVLEEGGQVLVKATSSTMGVVTSDSWSTLKNLGEEANMVIQWIHTLSSNTEKTPQLIAPRGGLSGESATTSVPQPSYNIATDDQLMATSVDDSDLPNHTSSQWKQDKSSPHYEDILSVFQKAIESEDWEKVKHSLENSILLNNRDTGGHFLDLQAALLHSSSSLMASTKIL